MYWKRPFNRMQLEGVAADLKDPLKDRRFERHLISGIAYRYGFSNVQNFSAVFRSRFSESPRSHCANIAQIRLSLRPCMCRACYGAIVFVANFDSATDQSQRVFINAVVLSRLAPKRTIDRPHHQTRLTRNLVFRSVRQKACRKQVCSEISSISCAISSDSPVSR